MATDTETKINFEKLGKNVNDLGKSKQSSSVDIGSELPGKSNLEKVLSIDSSNRNQTWMIKDVNFENCYSDSNLGIGKDCGYLYLRNQNKDYKIKASYEKNVESTGGKWRVYVVSSQDQTTSYGDNLKIDGKEGGTILNNVSFDDFKISVSEEGTGWDKVVSPAFILSDNDK